MKYLISVLKSKTLRKWILFIILLLGYLFFDLIYLLIDIDFTSLTEEMDIFLSLIKYVIFMVLLIIIYRKYLKEKWKDFKNNFKEYAKISFKDWFTGFLIMLMANIIISKYITGLG